MKDEYVTLHVRKDLWDHYLDAHALETQLASGTSPHFPSDQCDWADVSPEGVEMAAAIEFTPDRYGSLDINDVTEVLRGIEWDVLDNMRQNHPVHKPVVLTVDVPDEAREVQMMGWVEHIDIDYHWTTHWCYESTSPDEQRDWAVEADALADSVAALGWAEPNGVCDSIRLFAAELRRVADEREGVDND